MALTTKEGEALVFFEIVPDWHKQTALRMKFAPTTAAVVMAIGKVDELIGELIRHRDTLEEMNTRRKDWKDG